MLEVFWKRDQATKSRGACRQADMWALINMASTPITLVRLTYPSEYPLHRHYLNKVVEHCLVIYFAMIRS